MFSQRLLKIKNWARTVKEIVGTEEISKVDFSNKSYISAEEKPLGSSFGEI